MINPPLKNLKRSLDFPINFNNKFLCFNFIVVGYDELKDLNINDIIQLKIRTQHFCYCEIVEKKMLTLDEIIVQGYHFFDMGCSEKEYREYWKKCKKDKKFVILFFKKITQLNLFEND